jgi:hypothetical protein
MDGLYTSEPESITGKLINCSGAGPGKQFCLKPESNAVREPARYGTQPLLSLATYGLRANGA